MGWPVSARNEDGEAVMDDDRNGASLRDEISELLDDKVVGRLDALTARVAGLEGQFQDMNRQLSKLDDLDDIKATNRELVSLMRSLVDRDGEQAS